MKMTPTIKSAFSILLLSAASLASAQTSAVSEMNSPNLRATNLPGVKSHIAPPAGFNALAASDSELASYGFPPRPDALKEPKGYAVWKKAITASKQRVFAKVEQTNISHGPAKQIASKNVAGTVKNTGLAYSSNWSGNANLSGASNYSANSFYFVIADYVVPVARQAYGACTGGWDYSSSWVGIDGWGSPDVLQAGSESDAYCLNILGIQYNSTYYSAWYEWYPFNEVRINNSSFPVAPGDDIFVEVWSTSPTVGHAYLVNYQTNLAVEYTFSAPQGTTLRGNSAEWIVERPSVNGSVATLTNYISDYFSDQYAYTFNYGAVNPGSTTSYNIDMLDSKGYIISYPTLLGTNAMWMQDANSARYSTAP
jgi:hypothetical protein